MTIVSLLGSVAIVLFSAIAAPAEAQVFKCKGANGVVVYQDGPCEGGSAVDTRSARGVSGGRGGSRSGSSTSGATSTKPTHPVVPEKMRR